MRTFYPTVPVINNTVWQRDSRCTSGSYYQLRSRIYAEHALAYAMAANAGVVKAIVIFYRIDSDSAFERFRSRIPINDVNTVHALTKHKINKYQSHCGQNVYCMKNKNENIQNT